MDELQEAERFNAELDELLEGAEGGASREFREDMALARRLLAADLSAESRVKKTLAESLDKRAEKVFYPGLFARLMPRPRTLALSGGVAAALLAPLAFHLLSGPEERTATLLQGFNRQESPMFMDGSEYEPGSQGLARGGIPGEGADVITPLNTRDPSNLILSPGIKGVAGAGSDGDRFLPVTVPVPPEPAPAPRPERPATARPAENAFLSPVDNPLSTFSLEADGASYAEARRKLRSGRLPAPEAVRVEDFVNAVRYGAPEPRAAQPLWVALESAACPWNGGLKLVRIHLKARSRLSDVKLQVEFNPARVKAYRLVGYESRRLKAQDFNDDKEGGGELAAGQGVTALYEVVPPGIDVPGPSVDALKYQKKAQVTRAAGAREVLTVKVRYKEPGAAKSRLQTAVLPDSNRPWTRASADFRFAAAAAGFAMLLRGSEAAGNLNYEMVLDLARPGVRSDPDGARDEMVGLVEKARFLKER